MTDLTYYKELELVKGLILKSNMEDNDKTYLLESVDKVIDKIIYLAQTLTFCPDCNNAKFQLHWKCEECKRPYQNLTELKDSRHFAKFLKEVGNKPEQMFR